MDGSIGSEKAHLGIVIVAIACPCFLPQIFPQNALRPLPCEGIFRAFQPVSSAAGRQRPPRVQSEEIPKSAAKVEEEAKRGHNCALVFKPTLEVSDKQRSASGVVIRFSVSALAILSANLSRTLHQKVGRVRGEGVSPQLDHGTGAYAHIVRIPRCGEANKAWRCRIRGSVDQPPSR